MRFGLLKGESGKGAGDAEEEKAPLGREDYPHLEQLLGYSFRDYRWLETALTHRSAHTKGEQERSDYERLEYLGDAVLDLAVAHLLLDRHRDAREGELSKMRAALVNTHSLAAVARGLGLGRYIILSRGEIANGGADRSSILADVLEAIIGAIYREAGFEKALAIIAGFFGDQIANVNPRDPKTELQEALHAVGTEPPVYLLESVEGPEHAPIFVSVVEVGGEIVGRGRGSTKKASQQGAAEQALARLASENRTPNTEEQEVS